VEPDEFLTRDEFLALSEKERLGYAASVVATAKLAKEDGDEARQVEFAIHFLDLSKWVLPPEEYERAVKDRFWAAAFEDAEQIRSLMLKASQNPDLTEEERADAAARLPALEAMIEHKRSLAELPEREEDSG
jgi:hypothetical protein